MSSLNEYDCVAVFDAGVEFGSKFKSRSIRDGWSKSNVRDSIRDGQLLICGENRQHCFGSTLLVCRPSDIDAAMVAGRDY